MGIRVGVSQSLGHLLSQSLWVQVYIHMYCIYKHSDIYILCMYLYKYHETLALLSLSTKMVYCLLRLSLHKRQQQQHKPANKAGKTSTASKPC